MSHLTRFNLINSLAVKHALHPKKAEQAVVSILNTMKAQLCNFGRIEIRRFGTLYVQSYDPKITRNPKSGENIHTPAQFIAKFKPGQPLSERINNKQSLNY